MLKHDSSSSRGARAPYAGELFRNPTLAKTFRALADQGRKGFYDGRVADEIVRVLQSKGAAMTLDDLKAHGESGSQDVEPISLAFEGQGAKGVALWECPPNGQGIVALQALGILEELEKQGKIKRFGREDHNSAEYLHAIIEALRIAFADAAYWVADPDVTHVPTQELLGRSYLSKRSKLFSSSHASESVSHGQPLSKSDTVYFAVTDRHGNGCSFINSNYAGFGTGIVPQGCGFSIQNRGANFTLLKDHPNVYAPGKRPYHTIIPGLVTQGDRLWGTLGVMGGFMQPQGHVQVLLNMLVFDLSPQAALDSPRVCIGAGLPDAGDVQDRTVFVEEGIRQETVKELRRLGHHVEVVTGHERALFGRGQVIRVQEQEGRKVFSGGSDLRGDGAAVPG